MNCPYCGNEMKEGYLFGSKDGALSFAKEVPSAFKNAKNAEGFIPITKLEASHRVQIQASVCEECRKVICDY